MAGLSGRRAPTLSSIIGMREKEKVYVDGGWPHRLVAPKSGQLIPRRHLHRPRVDGKFLGTRA